MRCGNRHEGCIVCDEALLACGKALSARCALLVIPAGIAGLRRQDAEANIRVANDAKGKQLELRVIQCRCF